MASNFVFYVLLVAVGERFAPTPGAVVVLALASSVAALCADLFLVQGRAEPGRVMGAFAMVAPWLTFDTRRWEGRLWTAWDERSYMNLKVSWPEPFEKALRAFEHDAGSSLLLGVVAAIAWWLSGRIAWRDHVWKLRAASIVGAVVTASAMILLVLHGQGLPTVAEYRARLPNVATLFDVGRNHLPPPEMDGKEALLDVGGLVAARDCKPSCREPVFESDEDRRNAAARPANSVCWYQCYLSLRRAPHGSCLVSNATSNVPVVLRRDAKHDLWFFDDGVDLLAYRGSDLKCIDLTLRDLLLDIKPSPAWLWGGGAGLLLALLAHIGARWLAARPRRGRADDRERLLLNLEMFTVGILFATMPPVASTLLGAFVW